MLNKKTLLTLLFTFLTLFLFGCCEKPAQEQVVKEENIVMKTFDVKGMTCEGCEGTIVSYVTKMDGVVSSKASHVKESVIVKYDESKTDMNAIMEKITSTGYKVNGLKETTPKD